MNEKSFSPSCERNQFPILEILKKIIPKNERKKLFEIGSGTGQHAVYFAPYFPLLTWFPSDKTENIAHISSWREEAKLKNIQKPFVYEVGKEHFPKMNFDYVFTANTFHIMSWKHVKTLIKALEKNLNEGAEVFIYGPFNYNGQYTSESNAQFDLSLKQKNAQSSIRSFEDVDRQMASHGFVLTEDFSMPNNNRLLHYLKIQKITLK